MFYDFWRVFSFIFFGIFLYVFILPFFSTVNQHYLVSCIIHFIFILKSDIDKLPPPPNHCTTSTTYECLKCGPGSLMNVHPFFLKKSNHAMESTTHQSAGLGNRVQLQLSGSKFTADHALATGQSWPLLLCHSEKMFLTVKVICSDFCLGKM